MSTRSTTHFLDDGEIIAIVYRHSDGYPEGAGTDLLRFIDECAKLPDPRFGDPSYLAAKYVVFLAEMFNRNQNANRLDFLSVGVCMQDPGDIEYRYTVECGDRSAGCVRNRRSCPRVRCFAISETGDTERKIPNA